MIGREQSRDFPNSKFDDNLSCSLFKGENCGQALLRSFFIRSPPYKGSPPKSGCFKDRKAIIITDL